MPTMFNHEAFLEEFRIPKPLLGTKRGDTMTYVTRILSRKSKALIIETGCVRREGDWEGAGQSTEVWDWIVKESGGLVGAVSVDNDPKHCEVARKVCPNVSVVEMDSIEWLTKNHERLAMCDLLYLDSMDHDPPYGPSELHAAGELAAAYEFLPSGCLVMIDDCNPDGTGKHYLARLFFERIGVKPVMVGHQVVWKKP